MRERKKHKEGGRELNAWNGRKTLQVSTVTARAPKTPQSLWGMEGGVYAYVCVCVLPHEDARRSCWLLCFSFPFFGLLFLLFCLCYPSCVLFRLIGDLESRANSRQDILQTPWLQFGQIINSERQAFGQQEWKLESRIAVLSGFLLFLLKCLTEVWIPHKHKRLHWSTRGDTDQKFKPALQTQLCSVWLVLKGQTFPVDGKVKKKVFSVIMLCIYLKFFCVSKFLKCFLL